MKTALTLKAPKVRDSESTASVVVRGAATTQTENDELTTLRV